ncbi:hypothetical protein CK1_30860 [Ruminococcus sp. SR1/5]|nr:hypothetical protein CK1_30860 [Ruminococcus sp. SR1/5]
MKNKKKTGAHTACLQS